jgi:isopenicillin N synthase-like dioxygenase
MYAAMAPPPALLLFAIGTMLALLPSPAVGDLSSLSAVPVIDIAAPLADAAAEVGAALRRYGFFYAKNHGVPEELIERQFEAARALFELPSDVKRSLEFVPELDIGYLNSQALDEESGAEDTKEGFMLTNNGVMTGADFVLDPADPLQGATLHWPPSDLLPSYEPTLRHFAAEVTRVNHVLNRLLFASLGLGEAERLALAAAPFTVVKQMRYMPGTAGANASELSLGAGAHADWGALTVLATDGTPGLEVELEGEWLPVPPRSGCLIINAGDQIRHWTNGEFRSATHRVRMPAPSAAAAAAAAGGPRARFSTAFFTYFDIDAVVSALPQYVSLPDRPALRDPETTQQYFHFKLFESTGNLPRPPIR